MKLYELNAEIQKLENWLTDSIDADTGEIIDEKMFEAIEAGLNDLAIEKDEKILNIAKLVKNYKADYEALKAESDKLKKKAATVDKKIDFLKDMIKGSLPEGEKIKDLISSIYWQKSESVEMLAEPELIPEGYQRVKIEADKTKIKKQLKDGENLEFARLETKQNLIIK